MPSMSVVAADWEVSSGALGTTSPLFCITMEPAQTSLLWIRPAAGGCRNILFEAWDE